MSAHRSNKQIIADNHRICTINNPVLERTDADATGKEIEAFGNVEGSK